MEDDSAIRRELIGKIHQFFLHEIQTNTNLSEESKESLSVGLDCVKASYGIESGVASNELLNIYKTHKSGQHSLPGFPNLTDSVPQMRDAMSLFQNLASSFLSPQAPPPSTNPDASSNTSGTAQQQTSNSETPNTTETGQTTSAKKERKLASDAEKIAADSFKNQGNDHMRSGNHKEAYDSYTKAIEIDPNNAIYYSNRAAASSKLNNHHEALKDCREAIEMDPTYAKAYGRMGLAYANIGDHKNSRDAYKKAVELDPDNEAHRDNLAIEEGLCNETQNSRGVGGAHAGAGQPTDPMSILTSMFNNPNMIQMAMRTVQDPRIQTALGSIVTQMQGQPQQPPNPSNPQNPQNPPPPPPGTS